MMQHVVVLVGMALGLSGCREEYITTSSPYVVSHKVGSGSHHSSTTIRPSHHSAPPEKPAGPCFKTLSANLSSLERYIKVYDQFHAMQVALLPREDDPFREVCPTYGPMSFEIDGEVHTISRMDHPDGYGSQGDLFETSDREIVVKIGKFSFGDQDNEFAITDMQNRDRAGLAAMSGTGVVPEVYYPKLESFHPPIGSDCFLRTVFMDSVDGVDLFQAVEYYPFFRLPTQDVLQLATLTVKQLKHVHDAGIIHGDIHLGNWLVRGEGERIQEVILIDFGRSMPYIDPRTNKNRPAKEMHAIEYPGSSLNNIYLSMNELMGLPIGPNDDLFRLAECLVQLAMGVDKYLGALEVAPSVRFYKQNFDCTVERRIPPQVCAFYLHTRKARFEEPPIYPSFT